MKRGCRRCVTTHPSHSPLNECSICSHDILPDTLWCPVLCVLSLTCITASLTQSKTSCPINMVAEQGRTAEEPTSDENAVGSRRAAWHIIARTERRRLEPRLEKVPWGMLRSSMLTLCMTCRALAFTRSRASVRCLPDGWSMAL